MNTILANLLPLLVTLITPAILLLMHKMISAIVAKWNLGNIDQYNQQLDALVEQGIQAAEQWASNQLKAMPVNMAVPPANKLEIAKMAVTSGLAYHKMVIPTDHHLTSMIESSIYRAKQAKAKV